jgi:hypothetical protein
MQGITDGLEQVLQGTPRLLVAAQVFVDRSEWNAISLYKAMHHL